MFSQSREIPSGSEREGPLSLDELRGASPPLLNSPSLSSSATDADNFIHAGTSQQELTHSERSLSQYQDSSPPHSLIQNPSAAELQEVVNHPQPSSSHFPKSVQPEFQDEVARLKTFSNWPKTDYIEAGELAKAGLIYDPIDGHSDRVRCAFCENILESWEENHRNKAFLRHAECFSHCPFVQNPTSPQAVEEVQMCKMKCARTFLLKKI